MHLPALGGPPILLHALLLHLPAIARAPIPPHGLQLRTAGLGLGGPVLVPDLALVTGAPRATFGSI